MAYDESKLTTLGQLKALAETVKSEDAKIDKKVTDLTARVDDLVTAGGEPNVITAVKVDGTALEITDKAVDIGKSIADAVAGAAHLKRKIVDSVEDIDLAAADADQYIYMIAKPEGDDGDQYDEYMVIGGKAEKVGDWAVDLSGYVSNKDLATDEDVSGMLAEIFGTSETEPETEPEG